MSLDRSATMDEIAEIYCNLPKNAATTDEEKHRQPDIMMYRATMLTNLDWGLRCLLETMCGTDRLRMSIKTVFKVRFSHKIDQSFCFFTHKRQAARRISECALRSLRPCRVRALVYMTTISQFMTKV